MTLSRVLFASRNAAPEERVRLHAERVRLHTERVRLLVRRARVAAASEVRVRWLPRRVPACRLQSSRLQSPGVSWGSLRNQGHLRFAL